MDLTLFLDPPRFRNDEYSLNQLGNLIRPVDLNYINFEELKADIAIVGVNEDRGSLINKGSENAPDFIRNQLLQLYSFKTDPLIIDLGNVKKGFKAEDTYFALTSIIEELLKKKIIPVIIGGSQELTFSNYKAYENIGETINLVTIDSRLDLGNNEDPLNSENYLSKIILHQPSFLFNFSNIGFQSYYTDPNNINLIEKLFFDAHRLGNVRSDLEEVEPIVRNADLVSFDVSAIRHSECPGNKNSGPNGFFADEACRISRYAGLSDKLTSIGFYETNPELDPSGKSFETVAQMIWYFCEGFYARKNDKPENGNIDYTKFRVNVHNSNHEIVFFKSNKSDRWWMDVPYPGEYLVKFERHHLVPCSYKDYLLACNEEMPDRWWQTYQKLC